MLLLLIKFLTYKYMYVPLFVAVRGEVFVRIAMVEICLKEAR